MTSVKNRRRRGYTRVSAKHQITIPARALAEAGLGAGDELKVDVDAAGRIVLSRAAGDLDRRPAVRATAGILDGVYTPGMLEKLRNEWR